MSRSSTDNDPLLGRVLDSKYTLLSVLGRGGMGVVYKAHQKSLERSVALKLMMGVEPERENEFQRRFFLEAATAARLKHPNTITVFDYGSTTVDGERVYYITMELLDGVTLSQVLSKGALAPIRAVNIAMQICRSLREAHAAGIVHRDLKPGNVMLVKQDQDDSEGDADFVKVLDFGLAKTRGGTSTSGSQLTKAGTFLGSPRYVAPEQIEGKPIDGRADIYSFGCVFYRMLTGRVPFDGSQAVEVMLKHLHDPVPPLATAGIPASLEALVLSCLEKKAADRSPTMDDVLAGLRRVRQELGGGGPASGLVSVPDDIQAQLREALAESPPITLLPKEQTSPSQTTPPLRNPPDSQPSWSPSAPSMPPPLSSSPSISQTPSSLAALAQSGEWRIGDVVVGEPSRSRSSIGPRRPEPRRAGAAIIAGVVVGLAAAGVGLAWRLGHLDPLLVAIDPPPPSPPPSGPTATAAVSARLRIKTTPAGADVLDVSAGVPRLLGITPLVVPWEVAPGDGARTLQLRLPGHVPAVARVEPPAPSASGEPVHVDVEAALRPLPTTPPARR
jgi:eukaryotic-like serine/threonine-protein kinase